MPISSASAVGGTPPEQSASCIVGKTAAGSHTLTIKGFSLITKSNERRNKSITSSTFTAGGHTWCAELRWFSDRIAHLGGSIYMVPRLCCTHCTTGEEVSAAWSFTLLDHNGQPSSYSRSTTGVCKYRKRMSTGVALVTNNFLESQAATATYLPGDCLKIRCDVTVYKEPRCEDRDLPSCLVAVPPPDMGDQLGRLLSSVVGADLTFQVTGETFSVHRHILAVRSPVLLDEIIISSGALKITEAGVSKALLHYIYTDSLPNLDDSERMYMAQHVIAAADRYSLDRLKLICEDMLCRRVDTSTVAAMLALAEKYNCRGLKKACFQFLMSDSNLKGAMADGGFERLRSSCPSVLKELLAVIDPPLTCVQP